MEAIVLALALNFTLPGRDHYAPDFQLINMGSVATEQQCDAILTEPFDLRINGGTETEDMKISREGLCIKGVPEAQAKASMMIEAAARVPRTHTHFYNAIVLPHFATLQQCNRTVSKLSALLPKDTVGKHVDIWATCYPTK